MSPERLTDDERRAFLDTPGYLEVPGALTDDQVERVAAAVDRHAGTFHPGMAWSLVNTADVLGLDDAFIELIDLPRVLPKIADLLGTNIWVYHSHMNVNPPLPPGTWKPGDPFMYSWHRDGGVMSAPGTPGIDAPLLSIKVGFYLTDVEEDGGPTFVVEGSQHGGDVPAPQVRPPAARPLAVRRGTAVIFGSRVVHSGISPNASPATRKAVFIAYAHRWIQPLDRATVGHLVGKTSPLRQQLLGLTQTYNIRGRSGRFYPTSEDVPLRAYMASLGGA